MRLRLTTRRIRRPAFRGDRCGVDQTAPAGVVGRASQVRWAHAMYVAGAKSMPRRTRNQQRASGRVKMSYLTWSAWRFRLPDGTTCQLDDVFCMWDMPASVQVMEVINKCGLPARFGIRRSQRSELSALQLTYAYICYVTCEALVDRTISNRAEVHPDAIVSRPPGGIELFGISIKSTMRDLRTPKTLSVSRYLSPCTKM